MSGTATAVLFDVDGTLADSSYLHVVCWREALRQARRTVPMAALPGGILGRRR